MAGEGTLQRVVRAHDARPEGAEPAGRLRSLAVIEDYRHVLGTAAALRRLLDDEPTTALRVLTDPHGRVQPRLAEACTGSSGHDVAERGLTPGCPSRCWPTPSSGWGSRSRTPTSWWPATPT